MRIGEAGQRRRVGGPATQGRLGVAVAWGCSHEVSSGFQPTKVYEKGYPPVNVRAVGSNYMGPYKKSSSYELLEGYFCLNFS